MFTSEVDFKKEGYYTVGSDKIGMDRWAIFDSSSFNKGDEIYFKITADYFNSNYLDFFFLMMQKFLLILILYQIKNL